jgi:hypothetical protein
MLSKKTYGQVVKKLEQLKKQDQDDRRENTVRENHERFVRGSEEETMKYLEQKGLLVPYCGGYSFPGNKLPTEAEVRASAEKLLKTLYPEQSHKLT